MLERRTARPSPNRENIVLPAPFRCRSHFSPAAFFTSPEQDRPAVAELRHPRAELVARVLHRHRLAARQELVAGEVLDELGLARFGRIEVDEPGGVRVERDQVGIGDRRRLDALVKRRGQPGVGVVERQVGERAHAVL